MRRACAYITDMLYDPSLPHDFRIKAGNSFKVLRKDNANEVYNNLVYEMALHLQIQKLDKEKQKLETTLSLVCQIIVLGICLHGVKELLRMWGMWYRMLSFMEIIILCYLLRLIYQRRKPRASPLPKS